MPYNPRGCEEFSACWVIHMFCWYFVTIGGGRGAVAKRFNAIYFLDAVPHITTVKGEAPTGSHCTLFWSHTLVGGWSHTVVDRINCSGIALVKSSVMYHSVFAVCMVRSYMHST